MLNPHSQDHSFQAPQNISLPQGNQPEYARFNLVQTQQLVQIMANVFAQNAKMIIIGRNIFATAMKITVLIVEQRWI